MQGHAIDHAIFSEGGVNCTKSSSIKLQCDNDYIQVIQNAEKKSINTKEFEYKTNNKISDLSQPDWDIRTFKFKNLVLDNGIFSTGRNAAIYGSILSNNSSIILGDDTAYIDIYSGSNITDSGFNFRQAVDSGSSVAESRFTGGITATGGTIDIGKKAIVNLNNVSSLYNTSFSIQKGARVTISNSLLTNGNINSGGELLLTGNTAENNITAPTIFYSANEYNLTDDGAIFKAQNLVSITGDIKSGKATNIYLGLDDTGSNRPVHPQQITTLLNGFDTSYQGNIYASKSKLAMNNAIWENHGDSLLKELNSIDSMIRTNSNEAMFNTITVDKLITNDTTFVMRTNMQNADKLVVNKSLSGNNNLLLVDFIEKKGNDNRLNIDLVSAPKGAPCQSIGHMSPHVWYDKFRAYE